MRDRHGVVVLTVVMVVPVNVVMAVPIAIVTVAWRVDLRAGNHLDLHTP